MAGPTLLHCDVRSDNLLVTSGGVVFVDWPHACVGAPVFDLVAWAPSVALEGGPAPEELLALSAPASAVDPDGLAVAGRRLQRLPGAPLAAAASARAPDAARLPGRPGRGGAGLAPSAHGLVMPGAPASRPSRFACMRFGLQIPNFTTDETPGALFDGVVAMATAAEETGFDSVWVMDHFYQLPPMGGPSQPMLDAYTLLGALATQTSRVRLGTMVTGVTYRNPAHLAKIVTTLDVISAGRAILGIGAAWYDVEHEGLGFDFPPAGERLDRLEEALQICRAMFTEEAPSFDGRYYRIHEARNVPPPVQPGGPPILIGGGGEKRTLQAGGAVRRHDEHLRRRRHRGPQGGRAARPLRGAGRDPSEVTVSRLSTLMLTASAAGDGVDPGLPAPGHRRGAHDLGHRHARRARGPRRGAGGGRRAVLHLQHADGFAGDRAAGGRAAGRSLRRLSSGALTRRATGWDVGVRAARRPGTVATTTASARATTPIATIVPSGTVGSGTALISAANRSQSTRPRAMPAGIPTCAADDGGHACLHATRGRQLAPGEAERLEDGQVTPSAPDRRHEGDAERGGGPGGERGAEEQRASCRAIRS